MKACRSAVAGKFRKGLFLLLTCAISSSLYAQTRPRIMTWGENTSSWNSQLGLMGNREGCSATPSACVADMDAIAKSEGVKEIYLSTPFNLSTLASYAKQYSQLSLTHPVIVSIGLDDFVGKIEGFQIAGSLPNPGSYIAAVINATKSVNPKLGFGVTIYEDSLTHKALTDAVLPLSVRSRIDYVHLYLHYRMNAANYATYVSQAKAIFPNAKIIAGGYPYDRIDYLPCAFKGTVKCTALQEQSLYKQATQIQANLLKQGTIYGMEFFFGYFGMTSQWGGWSNNPRTCPIRPLVDCWTNTDALHTITRDVLKATFSTSTAVVKLQYTSLYMGSEYVNKLSGPGNVLMTNTGNTGLVITSIGVGGVNGNNFTVSENCPTTLAAGASCTLTVHFKPTTTGYRYGEIIIVDSAGTQYVALKGLGI